MTEEQQKRAERAAEEAFRKFKSVSLKSLSEQQKLLAAKRMLRLVRDLVGTLEQDVKP